MKKEIIKKLIESIKKEQESPQAETDLDLDIEMLEKIEDKSCDQVEIGSLIDLKLNDNTQKYFLSPTSGGSLVHVEGTPVLVISAFSKLGSELMGKKMSESFNLDTQNGVRKYTIAEVS